MKKTAAKWGGRSAELLQNNAHFSLILYDLTLDFTSKGEVGGGVIHLRAFTARFRIILVYKRKDIPIMVKRLGDPGDSWGGN